MTTDPTGHRETIPIFPRQPGHVVITFTAEVPSDADRYIQRVYTLFQQYSGDDITRQGYTLTIHPRAVND